MGGGGGPSGGDGGGGGGGGPGGGDGGGGSQPIAGASASGHVSHASSASAWPGRGGARGGEGAGCLRGGDGGGGVATERKRASSRPGNARFSSSALTSDAARCVDVNHRPVGNPKRKV
jgi:hypothetical protein